MTPSRIACAVDFSANGKAVLAQALALSECHDAELDVLYVRPGRRARQRRPPAVADEGLRAHLAHFVAERNERGTTVRPVVLNGDPVTSVVAHVRQEAIDLVVVGQDGPRRALYWSRGACAAAIARRVDVPTFTVTDRHPVPSADADFRRIVCGVDASMAATDALRKALTIAQQSGGHLTVLHVLEQFPHETVYSAASVSRLVDEFNGQAREITRQLRMLVPSDALNWCEVDYRVVPGVPHSTIAAIAAAEAADLVVIGRPPRSWLGAITSTTAGVLARATCPVLTVPGAAGLRPDATTRRVADVDEDEFGTLALRARPTWNDAALRGAPPERSV